MRFSLFFLLCFFNLAALSADGAEDSLASFLKQYHLSAEKRSKGYSELAFAIAQRRPEIAEILIKQGANLNEKFEEGSSTPMSLAILNGYDLLVQLMLDRKADANTVILGIYDGCMPQAINEYFPDRICGPDHYSLLQLAIKEKQPHIVRILLDHGADPHYVSKLRYRPIHLAIRHQQPETLLMLLNRGADPNATDLWGYAPLHYAAFLPPEANPLQYAELLMERNANVNQKIDGPIGKFGPLHLAAFNGHVDLVQALIRRSALVDLEDGQGCTPLWCAVNGRFESRDIIRGLIQGGANPNRINRFEMVGPPPNLYFYTPLTLAILRNKLEAARAILENHGNPNQMDGNGETPLLVAVNEDNSEAIELLLGFGANPSTKNRLGDSPIDRAVDKKSTALLDLLIKGQVNFLSR